MTMKVNMMTVEKKMKTALNWVVSNLGSKEEDNIITKQIGVIYFYFYSYRPNDSWLFGRSTS